MVPGQCEIKLVFLLELPIESPCVKRKVNCWKINEIFFVVVFLLAVIFVQKKIAGIFTMQKWTLAFFEREDIYDVINFRSM